MFNTEISAFTKDDKNDCCTITAVKPCFYKCTVDRGSFLKIKMLLFFIKPLNVLDHVIIFINEINPCFFVLNF